jgi:flagellar biogenesis protein FliO
MKDRNDVTDMVSELNLLLFFFFFFAWILDLVGSFGGSFGSQV